MSYRSLIFAIVWRMARGTSRRSPKPAARGSWPDQRTRNESRRSQPGRWKWLRSVTRGENAFAAAVRKLLPNGVADKCRIQVIVQMAGDPGSDEQEPVPMGQSHASENAAECHSDSSH